MKTKLKILILLSISMAITACGPADIHTTENPKFRDILANETAFVIPLEGNTKKNQGKFGSASFLEKKKVAAKRIHIPRTKLDTGRMPGYYTWLPTVKIITVDRSPIVMNWETAIDCIKVESRDSIGFCVGITIAAEIREEDTAQFLYSFPSGSLGRTLAKSVKARATESLGNKFATYDLEGSPATKSNKAVPGARQQKGVVVAQTKSELVDYFLTKGVTITSFGLVGGLSYEDSEIQSAINENFKSELEIKNAQNGLLKQVEVNAKLVSIAVADKDAAIEFRKAAKARTAQVNLEIEKMNAEARLIWSKNWNGKLPTQLMPDNSNMLMQLK